MSTSARDLRRTARRGASAFVGPARRATPAPAHEPVEYVFEPNAGSTEPLGEYILSVWDRRRFIVELARAELRGTRSNTTFGRIWGVLDPAFQAAVYFFLFTVIRGDSNGRTLDFLPAMLGGIFLLTLSTGALTEGGRSIRKQKGLMLNSTFPRALLPLVSIYTGLLAFVPSMGVYAIVHVVVGSPFGPGLALLPLLFVVQIVMNVGIALLTATLVVFSRDASNFLNYVVRILFFTTPVIYPLALLPDGVQSVLAFQPLFGLFASYQTIILGGTPNPWHVVQAIAWATALLVVGVRVFRRYERGFAMHL